MVTTRVIFHSFYYCHDQTNSSSFGWRDLRNIAPLTPCSASLLKVPAPTTVPGMETTHVSNPF